MLSRLVLASSLLFVASSAHGSVIDFFHDGDGLASVGGNGLVLEAPLDFFGAEHGDLSNVWFALTTGAPDAFNVDPSGGSSYGFTDAVITFSAEGRDFTVDVLPFTIELSPVVNDPVWDGEGPVALMPGLLQVQLGAGKLDQSVAKVLGIHKKVTGGTLNFIIDDFRGDPLADERPGVLNFLSGSLEVKGKDKGHKAKDERVRGSDVARAVPEPALLALFVTGSALALTRRRRS